MDDESDDECKSVSSEYSVDYPSVVYRDYLSEDEESDDEVNQVFEDDVFEIRF